jgi:DNA-binding transcriptional ArsR family regulator
VTDHDPSAVFAALSDPTRREVMRRLSDRGPSTLSELAEELPVSRQAISKHLLMLEQAGLVTPTGEERRHRYVLTPGPLTDAMGWIADVGADWDERLAALKRHVERRTP